MPGHQKFNNQLEQLIVHCHREFVGKVMRGIINGGGLAYTFENLQGDIYIRKGK